MDSHPLAVKGTKAETRWSQSRHEIWSPLPVKQITCSVSGAGKSSMIQAAVNALFDHFDYFAVYSHSHTLDPSYGDLKDKIRAKYLRTGIDGFGVGLARGVSGRVLNIRNLGRSPRGRK